jgi:hypothetical protein
MGCRSPAASSHDPRTRSIAEFLHTVPGLDIVEPEKASINQDFSTSTFTRRIRVLTPVSLLPEKLHCLRHFSQEHRQDVTPPNFFENRAMFSGDVPAARAGSFRAPKYRAGGVDASFQAVSASRSFIGIQSARCDSDRGGEACCRKWCAG